MFPVMPSMDGQPQSLGFAPQFMYQMHPMYMHPMSQQLIAAQQYHNHMPAQDPLPSQDVVEGDYTLSFHEEDGDAEHDGLI